jgi:hypothetical protein
MPRNEFVATLVSWLFVLCGSILLMTGAITLNQSVYVQGCVVLWGAVPMTWVCRPRWLAARAAFVVATLAYFASAIVCIPEFTQGIVSSQFSPWWHWLTAMSVLLAAGLACADWKVDK